MTTKLQVAVFWAESVAEYSTVTLPTLKLEPGSELDCGVMVSPELSVTVGAVQVTMAVSVVLKT